MKQGILWFDDSNTNLAEKIDHAVEYVRKKYRKVPRFCYVHPSMLENGTGLGRDGLKCPIQFFGDAQSLLVGVAIRMTFTRQ